MSVDCWLKWWYDKKDKGKSLGSNPRFNHTLGSFMGLDETVLTGLARTMAEVAVGNSHTRSLRLFFVERLEHLSRMV